MVNSIEKLEEELKAKEKLFDEKYVQNNANDCLSEEAEKMRKEIWQLGKKINKMKENKEITNLEKFELIIADCKQHKQLYNESFIGEYDIEIMEYILLDYKKILKENEKYRNSDYETICLENNELREIVDKIQTEYNELLKKTNSYKKENEELNNRCRNLDKEAQAYLEELAGDNTLTRRTIKQLQEENEELNEKILDNAGIYQLGFKDGEESYIKKVKDIIDRIDYDIKKTKEIISKNTNIYASYRKNDYQITRLKAMNTKSLDIKNRLQELLEKE